MTFFGEFCYLHNTNTWLQKQWFEKKSEFLSLAILFKRKKSPYAKAPKVLAALFKEYKGIRDVLLEEHPDRRNALFLEPEDKSGKGNEDTDNTLYKCEFGTAPIREMCRSLEKCLYTNIQTHARSRVKTFLLIKRTAQSILTDE